MRARRDGVAGRRADLGQLGAELAAGTGDEDPHYDAVPLFSGSHHQRLSRYHCTVSARESSKRALQLPAEGRDLVDVHRVAPVVAEAVGDGLDVRLVAAAQLQQSVGQLAVGDLVVRADVVDLADRAPVEHELDGAVVVLDVDPVAHVATVAVQRHLGAVEQVGGEQRDDLLRELVRPEVVRAAGDDDRQAVGRHVGEGDQVRAGLGRRVRRARRQLVGLGEAALLDRAVDLVGGDVHEPADADLAGDVAQHVGAEAVGAHERVRVDDRAVDVRLGGEVDDGVVAVHPLEHGVLVADVGVDELDPAVVHHVADRGEVAGVGERVEDRHLVVGVGQQPADVVGADEPGGTGDEQLHRISSGRVGAHRPVGPAAGGDRVAPRVGLVAGRQDRVGDAPVGGDGGSFHISPSSSAGL